MKKILSSALALMLFYCSPAEAFIAISQTMGPNSYSTTLVELYAPLSKNATIDASYTTSSYSGGSSRISYGGELHANAGKRTDVGAGFVMSPESGGSRYRAWDISGGYTLGSGDLKARIGLYFQDTTYEELSGKGLNQFVYAPSVKVTLFRALKLGYSLGLFNYSESVNSFAGPLESWSLRNNRDFGSILGVVSDFPSRTDTISAAYRIIRPLEIYGEWSRISYERSLPADTINAYGIRYFLTENFAFSVNLVSFNDESYNTLGFGLYW